MIGMKVYVYIYSIDTNQVVSHVFKVKVIGQGLGHRLKHYSLTAGYIGMKFYALIINDMLQFKFSTISQGQSHIQRSLILTMCLYQVSNSEDIWLGKNAFIYTIYIACLS